ncbi:MAG: CopG family transcriptional regulator [Desulfomonile sp.]|nr:CopG family transcriptional regulator [Desulfomonile sp.]
MPSEKHEIITFKVPESLKDAMKGVPNRSEFIRNAILTALDSVCPLCKGTGIFSPHQKEHWKQFTRDHSIQECEDCHALHLVCDRSHGSAEDR